VAIDPNLQRWGRPTTSLHVRAQHGRSAVRNCGGSSARQKSRGKQRGVLHGGWQRERTTGVPPNFSSHACRPVGRRDRAASFERQSVLTTVSFATRAPWQVQPHHELDARLEASARSLSGQSFAA